MVAVTGGFVLVIGTIVLIMFRTNRRALALLERTRTELREALEDRDRARHTLQQLSPICSACKRIRDGAGKWREVEVFLGEALGLQFTHGVCERCQPASESPH